MPCTTQLMWGISANVTGDLTEEKKKHQKLLRSNYKQTELWHCLCDICLCSEETNDKRNRIPGKHNMSLNMSVW